MTLQNKTAIAAAVILGCANNALAETDQIQFSVGLGAMHISDHYAGDNDETLIVPLVSITSNRFAVDVLEGASFSFFRNDTLDLKLLATPRFTNLDDPDADELRGIDRQATLDVGLGFDYAIGETIFSTSFLAEVTGEHNGYEIDAKVGRVEPVGKALVAYAIGASWQSQNLSDYRFGVRASEALIDRPAFTANASIAPYAEIFTQYLVSNKWAIIGGGQFTLLAGDAKDSPIVSSDISFAVFSGIARKFSCC